MHVHAYTHTQHTHTQPYRYGGRDFGHFYGGRGRLSQVGSYASSIQLSGRRRLSTTTLPSTTASGRSTPDNHSTTSFEQATFMGSERSEHLRRYEELLARRRVSPVEQPSAFRRPSFSSGARELNSRGERRYNLDSYAHPSGFSSANLLRMKQQNVDHKRDSYNTETDEEMSCREEDISSRLRTRRESAPVRSPLEMQEGRWDFKTRRSSNPYTSYKIPIGRVSPLTPPETSRAGTSSPFPKQLTRSLSPSSVKSPTFLKPVLSVENAAKAGSSDSRREDKDISTSANLPSLTPSESSSACLKGVEVTLQKASQFMKDLKTLAESGSSDQDSDSEPHAKTKNLTSYWQEKVVEQVKSAMTPTRMEPYTVELKPDGADFGFSVADGLIEPGVYIKSVRLGGPADQKDGLQSFDRILKVSLSDKIVQTG